MDSIEHNRMLGVVCCCAHYRNTCSICWMYTCFCCCQYNNENHVMCSIKSTEKKICDWIKNTTDLYVGELLNHCVGPCCLWFQGADPRDTTAYPIINDELQNVIANMDQNIIVSDNFCKSISTATKCLFAPVVCILSIPIWVILYISISIYALTRKCCRLC